MAGHSVGTCTFTIKFQTEHGVAPSEASITGEYVDSNYYAKISAIAPYVTNLKAPRYIFKGWSHNGTIIDFTDTSGSLMVTNSTLITLVAVWEFIEYDILLEKTYLDSLAATIKAKKGVTTAVSFNDVISSAIEIINS